MARRGLQALITRPREEAENLAKALATRNIVALVEPVIEIHYHAAGAFDLRDVQALLCTSANGVRAVARASAERALPVFAVGDTTAARARAEGFSAVKSAGGDVDDLVRLVAAAVHPQGGRLLHIAGSIVAGDLSGALQGHGFQVERCVLYEARPATALSRTAVDELRANAIDFAFFFSPRTAAIFATLVGLAEVAECCGNIVALSISPAADAALAGLPWRDRRVAERPNQAALLDALDRVLSKRPQG
jgi:uroporphyrinogen-III synthase